MNKVNPFPALTGSVSIVFLLKCSNTDEVTYISKSNNTLFT